METKTFLQNGLRETFPKHTDLCALICSVLTCVDEMWTRICLEGKCFIYSSFTISKIAPLSQKDSGAVLKINSYQIDQANLVILGSTNNNTILFDPKTDSYMTN